MSKEKQLNLEIEKLTKKLEIANKRLKTARYGIVWMDVPEAFENDVENKIPVLSEVKGKAIKKDDDKPTHLLIEGDNYHALTCLNYTHKAKIDVIYIDPPYNTGETKGKDVFKYKDKRFLEEFPDGSIVPADHPFRHTYWLSFMHKRLELAHNLLSDTGVAIIHIDENELFNLGLLLGNRIFGEINDLGTIVWNKKNPKGDSRGVSAMHEYILVFAKNKEKFLELENTTQRNKPNAEAILNKAKSLFSKLNKVDIPEDIKEVIKPFEYPEKITKEFKVKYTLELINKEFKNWLTRSDFSKGEQMYKYIDENGDVYRGVSMAWPNKKDAPEHYFIPLKHPITNKKCPIPNRGWRNPPDTMKKLLGDKPYIVNADGTVLQGSILFGANENRQPERKYLLKENLSENTPSIYTFGGSDDTFFSELGIDFPYAKPVEVAKYLIRSIHPNPSIVIDFFAGSGTTLHAVLEVNKEEDKNIQSILVTNNENNICTDITYPRISNVIKGYKNKAGKVYAPLGNSLKYYRTDFVGKNNVLSAHDEDKSALALQAGYLLAIAENTLYEKEHSAYFQIFEDKKRATAIYFTEDLIDMEAFIKKVEAIKKPTSVYLFSWGNESEFEYMFDHLPNVRIKTIPKPILEIYKQIYNIIEA
jgi:hypothetical protein